MKAGGARRKRRKIELRPVRRQVERAITKLKRVDEPNRKVKQALAAMQHCLKQIKMICGPIMSIPIPSKPDRY